MKKTTTILLAIIIAFTFAPSADAVKKMDVKATSKTNSITLSWKKVNGATSYEVRKVLPKKWHKFKLVKKNKKNKKKFTKKGLFKITAKGKKYQVYKFYSKTEKFGKKNTTTKLTYTKNSLKANAKYSLIVNAKKKKKIIAKKTISVKTKKKTTTTTSGGSTSTSGGTNIDATIDEIEFNSTSVDVKVGNTVPVTADIGVKKGATISSDKFSVKSSNTNAAAKIKSVKTTAPCNVVVEITGKSAGEAKITLSGYNKSATVTAKVSAGSGGTEGGGVDTTQGLKYDYEIYKLKDVNLYEYYGLVNIGHENNVLLIKTDNPMTERTISLTNSSNYSYSGFHKPSELKKYYTDIGIDDKNDGKYNYIYLDSYVLRENGSYRITEQIITTSEKINSTNAIVFPVLSYSKEYRNWINSYIDNYSSYTSNKMKLSKIVSDLKSKGKYIHENAGSTGTIGYNNNLKIGTQPWWKSFHWDSSNREPIITFAKLLGAEKTEYYQVDLSKPNHSYINVFWSDGEVNSHSICPDKTTAPSQVYGTTTLNDFEHIGTIAE